MNVNRLQFKSNSNLLIKRRNLTSFRSVARRMTTRPASAPGYYHRPLSRVSHAPQRQKPKTQQKNSPIPPLDFHDKGVNLTVHGPMQYRVERWQGYELEILETLSEFNLASNEPHEVWICPTRDRPKSACVYRNASPMSGRTTRLSGYIPADSKSIVEIESERTISEQKARQQKLKTFRIALRERLRQRAETKKAAIKEVMDHYYS